MSFARSVGRIRATGVARRAGRDPWKGRMDSTIEATFEQGIRALKFPPWERNFVFLEDLGYELDFAWPQWLFGIEIEGHVHRIKENFERDLGKHALASLGGWTILRVGGKNIRGGEAFTWAEQLINQVARATVVRGA